MTAAGRTCYAHCTKTCAASCVSQTKRVAVETEPESWREDNVLLPAAGTSPVLTLEEGRTAEVNESTHYNRPRVAQLEQDAVDELSSLLGSLHGYRK